MFPENLKHRQYTPKQVRKIEFKEKFPPFHPPKPCENLKKKKYITRTVLTLFNIKKMEILYILHYSKEMYYARKKRKKKNMYI